MDRVFQLRRIETLVPRRADAFGGKARNLAALARAGFPVPAAYALSVEACDAVLDAVLAPSEKIEALVALDERELTNERLESIAERVRKAPLPKALEKELRAAFAELRAAGAKSVAVRSSSTQEDDQAASAAGLHTTVLHVSTDRALLTAVRGCWASLFEPRVLAYLRTITSARRASVGVVIQAMVPADVAGVMFTVNPLTGDMSEMVINASFGLGSPIVDGRVSPDFYRIDKATGAVRDRVVGDKKIRAFVTDKGVREERVPDDQAQLEAIDAARLQELVVLGRRIEQNFGDARDVEWAVAGGALYVLQARPVTTVAVKPFKPRPKRKDAIEQNKLVWSNVNVGEALPGVATPFTWSVASNFSDLGFRKAFGAIGCTVPKDAELVGGFRGRIYLNLSEMIAICSQVPGLRPATLLSMAGGGEIATLEAQREPRSSTGFLMRLPLTLAQFARENMAVSSIVEAFEADYEREKRRVRGLDLRILSPSGLGSTLRDVESLLHDAGAVMMTCYGNLLLSAVAIRTVLKLVVPESFEEIERGLTSGLADLESAAPGLALWHIAEMLRVEADACSKVLLTDPQRLSVSDLPDGPSRRALERFLDAYGGRGAREAEIAEPRWREDPSFLFATLRIHLERKGDDGGPLELERKQRAVRDAAEAELERRVPMIARSAVRHLLALFQRFVRMRERLRSHVTEVLGLFRDVALEAGRRIHAREGCGEDAAFFLTIDEVKTHLRGSTSLVAPLVRARRAQFARDLSLPDPPDTFVGFPPPAQPEPARTDELVGLGASSGRVQGRARVLASPRQVDEFHAGEILVAPYADVGWSPLFLVARALVTDLGGPLSHAAIVAREFGLPTVMNVKVGTRVIKTGDLIEVDGHRGVVRILESSPPAAAHGR